MIIDAERTVEGGGFVVRRPFPTARVSHIDPFLLLVLPQALALVLAMFTLSVLFVAATLVSGFASAKMIAIGIKLCTKVSFQPYGQNIVADKFPRRECRGSACTWFASASDSHLACSRFCTR